MPCSPMREALIKARLPPPAQRPEPRPPAELQPKSYSFSEVGRLRRDPYAIYARRILRLDPLEPFLADPGPRERGTLYHGILEEFVSDTEQASRNIEALHRIADRHFAEARLPDATALVWRMRFDKATRTIVDWESETAAGLKSSLVEARASLDLPLGGSEAHRHGRPDRPAPGRVGLDHRLQDRQHAFAQGSAHPARSATGSGSVCAASWRLLPMSEDCRCRASSTYA